MDIDNVQEVIKYIRGASLFEFLRYQSKILSDNFVTRINKANNKQ
jgi:hypothetical protein